MTDTDGGAAVPTGLGNLLSFQSCKIVGKLSPSGASLDSWLVVTALWVSHRSVDNGAAVGEVEGPG